MQIVTSALLAAHIAVLLVALFASRSATPLFLLNICMAVGALVYLGFNPRFLHEPVDWPIVAMGVVEVLVVIVAILGLRGVGMATMPSYAVFSVHFLITGAATAFAFLFKITRLF